MLITMKYILSSGFIFLLCIGGKQTAKAQSTTNKEEKRRPLFFVVDTFKTIEMDNPAFEINAVIQSHKISEKENIQNESYAYHKTISRFINAYSTFSHQDSTRVTAINQSIANLYMFALGQMQWEFLSPARVVVDIKDSTKYFQLTSYRMGKGYLKGKEWWKWANENAFCYELISPIALYEKRYDIMTSDLNQYFGALYGIQGRLGRRKINCMALVRTSKKDKILAKGQKDDYHSDKSHFSTHNGKLADFIYALRQNLRLEDLMLVDATAYTGKTDLEINCNMSDVSALNKELKKYDLKLKVGKNDIDMIILEEKK